MDQVSFNVSTFGCKVNTYDSGWIQKQLLQRGYASSSAKPRVHILNTCAVTAEATKEAVRRVRRLKAEDPLCTVVVTGCSAQVDTDKFEGLAGADLIVANSHKSQIVDIIDRHMKGLDRTRIFKSNIFKKEELEEQGGQELSHTRSFVKIQDGCNSFCTFCVIPFARGKSRSLPAEMLVEKIETLYAQGVREVVLTGVHIGDYEDDKGRKLEDLVEFVLAKTKMPRFRLSSLEPIELSDRLLDLYKDSRLCPHFHMSIQSGSTTVLERMKRKYTQADVMSAFARIERALPNAFVGMDVIVGFPGETEAEFQETMAALQDSYWTRIHVFPYSPRPGTYANKLPGQLDRSQILRQADRLRAMSDLRWLSQARRQIGQIKPVLWLKDGDEGLSHDYWAVETSSMMTPNTESPITITDFVLRSSGYALVGASL